ncbi:probable terpene synthase 13 isoform X2 [Rhododendron vialii]|uniref:probable terpene synthase 13 isoform X2 n=1 Tax=Rhododendron vialii TaxID=182163 RepID=UPI00265FF151|nr:probable terpene synthase 13 isoform X2 [Rhododendron vialii]
MMSSKEFIGVGTDVFKNIRDKEGKFKTELHADTRGLMGLYEASQLSIEGEDILDQAAEFSAQLLNVWMTNLDHHQARVVGNTLGHTYHKSLARFMAKSYLGDYRGPNGWVKRLQQLAKLDFQIVQSAPRRKYFKFPRQWKNLLSSQKQSTVGKFVQCVLS